MTEQHPVGTEPEAKPETAKAPEPKGDIAYLVLVAADDRPGSWNEVGIFTRPNQDAAKEDAYEKLSGARAEEDDAPIGALVAIADRNWNPEEYEVDEVVVRKLKPKGKRK